MKYYHCSESPIKIYGLAYNGEDGRFWKLDEEIINNVQNENVKDFGKRNTGGRVRFATNSEHFNIHVLLKTLGPDVNFSVSGSSGCDVYIGTKDESHFIGRVTPWDFRPESKDINTDFTKSCAFETITVNLPRNEKIEDIIIGIDDDADMLAPEPYTYETPIVFYGSSITEGCTAERPGGAYTALVSRWLDSNFRNLGFSGGARGEVELAEYIAKMDMSIFVYDYDHNAPSFEHLNATHEPFFKVIREARPDLPIIMMSAPDFDADKVAKAKRRAVIKRTYDNAVANGDNNVYFIDGESFYGTWHRDDFTIDGCHPNSIGFYRMAETLYPLLKSLLEK